MKIAYITSIDVTKHAASSNQVNSMCRAFNGNKHIQFYFFNASNYKRNLIKLNVYKGRYLKFLTPFFFIQKVITEKIENIYCRESFVALIYLMLGRNVFFELHELNHTKVEKVLLKIITRFKRLTFITVSLAAKVDLKKIYSSKVEVLPNGVFIEDYEELIKNRIEIKKSLYQEYPNKPNVLYTGSLYKGRDAHLVFTVAQQYENANFILVGGSSEQYQKIKSEFLNVDNVYHIPAVAQSLARKYQVSADFLIYPISVENKIAAHTSPLKLIEYMASSTPIIANSIGSVSEILDESNCFLIDDFTDSKQLIKFILNSPESSQKSKALSARKYIEGCTWSARVEKIVSLFTDIKVL